MGFSIAIFRTTPPSMAGTAGAMFNCALQLGSAVGLAAATSIETSVEAKNGGFGEYHGGAAVFWFFVGVIFVQAIAVIIFYRTSALATAGVDGSVDFTKDSDMPAIGKEPKLIEIDLGMPWTLAIGNSL